MEDIVFRAAMESEFTQISRQIATSYKVAYKGLMNQEYLSSIPDDFWVPILHECKVKGDGCIIAEHGDGIIGSAVFGKSELKAYPNDMILYAIYLSPQYIGYGIGHKLYNEVEKAIINQQAQYCVLEVLSKNKRAIQFYASHKYIKVNSFTVEENGMILPCETMRKKLY